MLSVKNTGVPVQGMTAAIQGMRNAFESWDISDSSATAYSFKIGEKDLKLAQNLIKAGSADRKFLRFINVYADITAPQFWWSQYDTYKVGTVANSTSKMHRLLAKPFTLQDFSLDGLTIRETEWMREHIINKLNELREDYLALKRAEKYDRSIATKNTMYHIWRSVLVILPESYNQTRTIATNYEVLRNQYFQRRNHKLSEWDTYCHWIESLPYAKELILFEDKTAADNP